jgi:predicted SAM-dependent methyltransferase
MDMTEDDTFRILKRLSFSELNEIYEAWWRTQTVYDREDIKKFFEGTGWTSEEFDKEFYRRTQP